MSRIDSRAPALHSLPLLLTVVFLSTMGGEFTALVIGLPPASLIATAVGALMSLAVPGERRTLQDRLLGSMLGATSLLLVIPLRGWILNSSLAEVGLPLMAAPALVMQFAAGMGIGIAVADASRVGKTNQVLGAAWGGLAVGALAFAPMQQYIGWRGVFDTAAVAAAAAAALWFRMARSQGMRAVSVVIALGAVGMLLRDVRGIPSRIRFTVPQGFDSAPDAWQLRMMLIGVFAGLAATVLTMTRRRGDRRERLRFLVYCMMCGLGSGLLMSVAVEGLRSAFNREDYGSNAMGLLAAGAALGAWRWSETRGLTWLGWLLALCLGIPVMIFFGPWLLLADVALEWVAPWPWLLALFMGGIMVGPLPTAGMHLLREQARPAALGGVAATVLSSALGYLIASAVIPSASISQAAGLSAVSFVLAMLIASAWWRRAGSV